MYFKNSVSPIPNLKDESGKEKISKKLNVFLVLLHVLFSFDVGFVKNNVKSIKIRTFIRCFSLFQCFVITCGIIYTFYAQVSITLVISYILVHSLPEYVALVILFTYFSDKTTFYDLQIFLHNVDSLLEYPSDLHRIELKFISSVFIVMMSRLIIGVIFCALYYSLYCFFTGLVAQFHHIPLYAFDTFLIMYFFIFYTVYCRVKGVREYIKSATDIVACQYLYKSIVDYTEDVKDNFNIAYLVILIFTTPSVMAVIYMSFVNFQLMMENPILLMFSYMTSLRNMLLILGPAIIAGMLSSEAEKMRIILHDRLRQERVLCKSHIRDLKRFMWYVEKRPFRLRACRIIPLDSSLPVIVLNLCITYLIVIVQTTHLV